MNKELARSHIGFDIVPARWFNTIAAVRDKLGENNIMQQYHLRNWITNGYTLYIRKDLADNSFVSYLGLISKFEQ